MLVAKRELQAHMVRMIWLAMFGNGYQPGLVNITILPHLPKIQGAFIGRISCIEKRVLEISNYISILGRSNICK